MLVPVAGGVGWVGGTHLGWEEVGAGDKAGGQAVRVWEQEFPGVDDERESPPVLLRCDQGTAEASGRETKRDGMLRLSGAKRERNVT